MGRHEEATRRMEETVASGFRSPRLGALHLLYMVRAGQSLDWNLLATCVRAGPERFLLAIAGHAHLLQGAGPGRFHNAMILLIARLNRTGARDLLAREAVRLLMGGRPERDRWGVFSDDPVGADLFRVFSALSAMADEARRRRVTTELKAATITGKRFAQAWSTLPSRTRELLRAFRSSR